MNSTYIIAEVAQSHEGSLGLAHSFIDAVAKSGADAVKFQTHIAEEESTPEEKFRIKMSSQDKDRFEYWKRMEFTESQWLELFKHCVDRNIDFISSPFSRKAISLLSRIGMKIWKLGSGEVLSNDLLDYIPSNNNTDSKL